MDGPLWEVDLKTLEATQLFDLVTALNIPISSGEQPHFKAAHTMNGQLYVCSNTFEEADFTRRQSGGRLAAWNGTGTTWNILERTAFVEVTGRHNFGRVVYALGWDDASVILKVKDDGDAAAPSYDENWQTYRLPKASHAWDHLWTTEWPRIREVESERYLCVHGPHAALQSHNASLSEYLTSPESFLEPAGWICMACSMSLLHWDGVVPRGESGLCHSTCA